MTPDDAIRTTLAYADLFQYPMTAAEIHRYLVKYAASQRQVAGWLAASVANATIIQQGDYYMLPLRESYVAIRAERTRKSAELWQPAKKYGAQIARLPFVKMVGVTGSLAVNNVTDSADIDYFIITANDRLWLCRMIVIGLVRTVARRGIELCPNYFLAERALALTERDIYTARELAQMVPLHGFDHYQRMMLANSWIGDYLPNAVPLAESFGLSNSRNRLPTRLGETILQTPLGTALELWEQRRKIAKFRIVGNSISEAAFSADCCKGHFDAHHAWARQQTSA
jgi:hypothetical protein